MDGFALVVVNAEQQRVEPAGCLQLDVVAAVRLHLQAEPVHVAGTVDPAIQGFVHFHRAGAVAVRAVFVDALHHGVAERVGTESPRVVCSVARPDNDLVLDARLQVLQGQGRLCGIGVAEVLPIAREFLADRCPADAVVSGAGHGRLPVDLQLAGRQAFQGQSFNRAGGPEAGDKEQAQQAQEQPRSGWR